MPAVHTPTQRFPGMPMLPRVRSLAPIAKTTTSDWISKIPEGSQIVTILDSVMSKTVAFKRYGMPKAMKRSMLSCAYIGPVYSCLYKVNPKPLWIHCLRIPPNSFSFSISRISSMPCSFSLMAQAKPADPPPMMRTLFCFIEGLHRGQKGTIIIIIKHFLFGNAQFFR